MTLTVTDEDGSTDTVSHTVTINAHAVHNLNTGENFANIQGAIDAVETLDGHTIQVDAGTFYENVDVYKQLNIYGTGAELTIVNAPDPNDHVFSVTAKNVNISGFTISGATTGKAGIYLNANHSNILNNDIINNYIGIYLASSGNSIENNDVSSAATSIYLYYATDTLVANNNASSGVAGIYLYYSDNNTVTNNTAMSNTGTGIYLYSSINNTLVSNIAVNNGYGIFLYHPSSGNNISYNNVYSNSQYDLYNYQPDDMVAEYNWWGSTNFTLIDEHIHDDEEGKGEVDFNPILDAAAPGGVAIYVVEPIPVFVNNTTVAEDAGEVIIAVEWDPDTFPGDTVIFDYATSDGTAVAGSDYTARAGTVSVPSVSGLVVGTIPIIDDTTAESNETFTVTLTDPNSGDATIGTATVTIYGGVDEYSESVDESGGTITTESGNAEVDIPANALTEDTSISISGGEETPDTNINAFQIQTGTQAVSLIYSFGPEGITFDETVTITLRYDDTGIDESTVDIYFYIAGTWEPQGASCDTELNICTLNVTHFSDYIVGAPDHALYAEFSWSPESQDEGSPIQLTDESISFPNAIVSWSWDFGDLGSSTDQDPSFTFIDNGVHTVTLTITDEDDSTDTVSHDVTILNVAPTVGGITAPPDPTEVGTPITASADFTDPGTLDTHTAEWDWGDSTTTGTVTESDGSGTVNDSHTYETPGVYTITLTVTDDDGDSGTSTFQYVVVYDPSGGFVTGGGWIDSPAGAYTPDPELTGKATFGFVSKYKKGATTPTGNTQFVFHVADLNFQSTSYDWLVIAGPKAKYKGVGAINGDGEYGFMLTAIDGQIDGGGGVDKFRIKIWDKSSDLIVYDNQMGDADDAIATTELGGGSIVIHKAKK